MLDLARTAWVNGRSGLSGWLGHSAFTSLATRSYPSSPRTCLILRFTKSRYELYDLIPTSTEARSSPRLRASSMIRAAPASALLRTSPAAFSASATMDAARAFAVRSSAAHVATLSKALVRLVRTLPGSGAGPEPELPRLCRRAFRSALQATLSTA